ncbi:MAG: hypothetical protein ACYC5N_00935 [Endomicrobiales bacterium]
MGKKKQNTMLVITISAKNKTFIERIPESETRIHRDPDFYRDIRFTFDSKQSLEQYRNHFIYGYLETLGKTGELPSSLLSAGALEITVSRQK